MTEQEKILGKIKKCLALAKSSNEHEAAAALRQAQKLMQAHGVTDTDVLAHQASEASVKAGARKTPPSWENDLVCTVAEAFSCQAIHSEGWNEGRWIFIGCGASPEVAQYAMTVLMRQLKRQRADFMQRECKRLKPANKTRRADLFCDAWVRQVHRQVKEFSGTGISEESLAVIEAYMAKKYPALGDLSTRDRNARRDLRDGDWVAISTGREAGKNVQLNHGISGAEQLALR